MKVCNSKLILAVAGALIVFATGCTKKPSRPTPDQTIVSGGAGGPAQYTQPANTGYQATTSYQSSGYQSGGSTGSYDASQFGNQGLFNSSTTTTTTTTITQANDTLSKRTDNSQVGVSSLQPIYFDFDRSAIKPSEFGKIQAVKDYLAKNPAQSVLFEGHCDWRGTAEYNMALGDRRANAAKRYAISIGVPADKIQTRSMGSINATERGSESQMARDRRDEIVILGQ